MKTVGFFLIAAGASSYILHAMDQQSRIMGFFGEYEKYAAPAAIAVGVILLILGLRKKKKDDKK
jgi:hypothetical protein